MKKRKKIKKARRKKDKKHEHEEATSKGLFRITVISAKDLIAADNGKSSDPYAKVKVGKLKQNTPIIQENLNPNWNTEFSFPHPGGKPPSEVSLEVKDDNLLQSNVSLGKVTIQTADLAPNTPVTSWHTLTGVKSGQIQVTLEYLPDEIPVIQAKAGVFDKLESAANRKIKQTASKTGKELTRSVYRVLASSTSDLVARLKKKKYSGTSTGAAGYLASNMAITLSTAQSELFEEEPEKNEDSKAVQQVINSMIDSLIGGLETASFEADRLHAKGVIALTVSGGLPFPFPDILSFGLGMNVKTDSIVNKEKREKGETEGNEFEFGEEG